MARQSLRGRLRLSPLEALIIVALCLVLAALIATSVVSAGHGVRTYRFEGVVLDARTKQPLAGAQFVVTFLSHLSRDPTRVISMDEKWLWKAREDGASHHLAQLTGFGLVQRRLSGARVYYSVSPDAPGPGPRVIAADVRRACLEPRRATEGWRGTGLLHLPAPTATRLPAAVARALARERRTPFHDGLVSAVMAWAGWRGQGGDVGAPTGEQAGRVCDG